MNPVLKEKLKLSKNEWLLALTGIYCTVSVMMNFLCMKPLGFGSNFSWMDGGLFVSWIVFMISNVVTEAYGRRPAKLIAGIATVVALFISLVAVIEVQVPTLPEYAEQNLHFKYIFSNGPRTILASAIAFFIGNLVNVEIIYLLKVRANKNKNDNKLRFTFRAVFSSIIGQIVDNGLFEILALAPIGVSTFELQWKDIFTIVATGSVIETALETFFIPFITIPLTRYLQKKS